MSLDLGQLVSHLLMGRESGSGNVRTGILSCPGYAPVLGGAPRELGANGIQAIALDGPDRPPIAFLGSPSGWVLFPGRGHMGRCVAVRHANKKPRPAPKFTHNLTGIMKADEEDSSLIDEPVGAALNRDIAAGEKGRGGVGHVHRQAPQRESPQSERTSRRGVVARVREAPRGR